VVGGDAAEFEAYRAGLFGLAYRLLGSADGAEDVVQDTFLRWHGADRTAIVHPSGWLVRVVTNVCLNRLTSARARRERYVGTWLPEPVLTAAGALGPLERAEQRESVSIGLLMLLERLSPPERAVFILREAFGYSHREVAEFVGVSEEHSRQLLRRARQHLSAGRSEVVVPVATEARQRWQNLVDLFLRAAQEGDLAGLRELLAREATVWADGGGVVAARRPVVGRDRVARYLAGIFAKYGTVARLERGEVNGWPAVLGWSGSVLLGVLVPEGSVERVTALYTIANPDKLRFAARQAAMLSRSGGLSGS
jgi:RNA polymerase sigma-70 factor (ECF subfamily)